MSEERITIQTLAFRIVAVTGGIVFWILMFSKPTTPPEHYRLTFQRDSALNVSKMYMQKYFKLQWDSAQIYQDLVVATEARTAQERRINELIERERHYENNKIKAIFFYPDRKLDSAFRRLYPRPDSVLRH